PLLRSPRSAARAGPASAPPPPGTPRSLVRSSLDCIRGGPQHCSQLGLHPGHAGCHLPVGQGEGDGADLELLTVSDTHPDRQGQLGQWVHARASADCPSHAGWSTYQATMSTSASSSDRDGAHPAPASFAPSSAYLRSCPGRESWNDVSS